MTFKKFIKMIIVIWRCRKRSFVYCSHDDFVTLLDNVFGLRFELESDLFSDDYKKGYIKGVESALFDCGIPRDYVFDNTEKLRKYIK